ncbi:hypothetical protein AGR56_10000 [Clostridium sp. DMHC 10]|uniref:DUF4363 family protein n=1 Tax=Clostridium sp. DMHC 10 TaxID=747377 RepID=UPI00069F08B0|nr:DUF4363 family protein [Clostridium sp. DMHC 10]KOF56929.1 hypothetical protein AGR56_10000 [Clostridium sp. DMHC 10]
MKNVIFSAALFACILGFSIYSIAHINKVCNSMLSMNSKIENSIKDSSWEEAEKNINTFSKEWDNHSNLLSVYVHHAETDDISMEVEKLSQSIKYKETKDSMESAHTIEFLINHIRDLEKINLQNIF